MKPALLIILLGFGLSLPAQHPFMRVDQDKTKKAISDDASPKAYVKLLDRFNQFDTSLTLEDYRLLYYGFIIQDTYSSNPDEKKREVVTALNTDNFDQSLVGHCDLLNVEPSSAWPGKQIYFDASEILKKEGELFGK